MELFADNFIYLIFVDTWQALDILQFTTLVTIVFSLIEESLSLFHIIVKLYSVVILAFLRIEGEWIWRKESEGSDVFTEKYIIFLHYHEPQGLYLLKSHGILRIDSHFVDIHLRYR